MTPPATAPTLDELARDPAQAATLPLEAARALLARCALAQGVLVARLLEAGGDGAGASEAAAADRLLDVEEAARTLGVSEDWLYRRVAKLPFAVRLGRVVRFSSRGIEHYIRSRAGR